ncbi:PaaI family thioesterase [Rhodococcus sp. NPDC060086]|uniref:PaaI family thioesterase n=1 Tax=Rhodococcus sp. NPDC060086 TaxID=3347055 RepID=UPI003669A159
MTSSASVESHNEDVVISSPPTGHVIEEVVDATRRIMASVLHTGRDNPHLARIRDTLREIADTLDEHSPGLDTRLVEMWEGNGPTRHSPVTGVDNPIAPPLEFRGNDDGSIRGETVLGLPYQGPPAKVHGGVSALLLDHALGIANDFAGQRGMTKELTVRYHRVAPLFEPLIVSARQVSCDGRKIHTTGEISTADGQVCVSAEGLFIDRYLPRPRAE